MTDDRDVCRFSPLFFVFFCFSCYDGRGEPEGDSAETEGNDEEVLSDRGEVPGVSIDGTLAIHS